MRYVINSSTLAATITLLALAALASPQARADGHEPPTVVKSLNHASPTHPHGPDQFVGLYQYPVNSGILECSRNVDECVIANMPLLWQSDPRIDPDVQSNSTDGCYDTSIVTVILAALANRNQQLQPGGRTKIFMNIPAGEDSHSQPVPKEIKQLSQQYRWQIHSHTDVGVQPFFMTEVVADFGAISQPCNPFVYGNCEKDTNGAAQAFSTWVTEDIPNIHVINLMKEGYVPLAGYQFWAPTVTTNADGTKSVKFTPKGQHKVAFSGFQQGKYPLLINDVGDGTQHRVRLTTDLSAYLGTQFQSVTYPMPTHTFIEYEDRPPSEPLYFIESLGGIRIAPANTKPLPSSREETAIIKDLFGKGCRPFLGRNDMDFLCTKPAGRAACETYEKNGQATQCRKAWK